MSETQWVDASDCSALAGCSCGWRSETQTQRGKAWTEAQRHALACHPGDVSPNLARNARRAAG